MALPPETQIPNVRKSNNPKASLESLLADSPRRDDRPQDVWGEIARCLKNEPCPHADETGLTAFAEDVRCELGPLVTDEST